MDSKRCGNTFRGTRHPSYSKINSQQEHLYEGVSESSLEKRIGYVFKDPDLRRLALVHRGQRKSYRFSGRPLEFLGDAVFNLSAFDALIRMYPHIGFKALNEQWNSVISNKAQADLAVSFKMDQDIHLDKYLSKSQANHLPLRRRKLANFLEALVGIVYLDGGYVEARKLVMRMIQRTVEKESVDRDYNDLFEDNSDVYFLDIEQTKSSNLSLYNFYIKRMEFLGHLIFNLYTIDIFMEKYPKAKPVNLNQKKLALRNFIQFSNVNEWNQDIWLRFFEMWNNGKQLHVKFKVFYFLLGAVHLQKGYAEARALVARLIEEFVAQNPTNDVKDLLYIFTQKEFQVTPVYKTVEERNVESKNQFIVEVWINGKMLGRGQGKSKKDATQTASIDAFKELGIFITRVE